MNRTISMAFMATLACIPVSAAEPAGAIAPPHKNGVVGEMGTCIPLADEFCAYSIAEFNAPDGPMIAVVAQKLVERRDGVPVWETIDYMDAPEPDEEQFWAFEECHVAGVLDPSVIGLVAAVDMGGWLETTETVWAAKFDMDAGKLMIADLSDIDCILAGS